MGGVPGQKARDVWSTVTPLGGTMSIITTGRTPSQDGFYMPGEFTPQKKIWMIWPYRPDTWRNNARPVQDAWLAVLEAILAFEPVAVVVAHSEEANCRSRLPAGVEVVVGANDDCWCRDTGPSFLINGTGTLRGCNWKFNSWGGDFDGLYEEWEQDDAVAALICDHEMADYYRTEDFVLEGGSIHVDGEGTVLTTKMCLLSPGRNPHLTQDEIESRLKQYLNCSKVLWVTDGIDPEETTGHIDDVACFVRPGEVACIYTEDPTHPFYEAAKAAYDYLSQAEDAKGRQLKVHKLCCTVEPVYIGEDYEVEEMKAGKETLTGDLCIASYANFLIVNGGVIVPQYGDVNDALAIAQIQEMFPERKVVGVRTEEIVYGGGNIHCITQQQPI